VLTQTNDNRKIPFFLWFRSPITHHTPTTNNDDVAMFDVGTFSLPKHILVGLESKIKSVDYGMVAMSYSWVLSLTRWLALSSVMTATRAAFSPEGK
jgi:hypothetical protein